MLEQILFDYKSEKDQSARLTHRLNQTVAFGTDRSGATVTDWSNTVVNFAQCDTPMEAAGQRPCVPEEER